MGEGEVREIMGRVMRDVREKEIRRNRGKDGKFRERENYQEQGRGK